VALEFSESDNNELDGETPSDEVSATAGRAGSDTVEELAVGLTRMVSVGLIVVVWNMVGSRRSSQA
jgi:hypothetical protein